MPAPESVVLETSLGIIQLELYWGVFPDLRKLRTVDEAWLLQRRGIPPHCCRTLS